MTLLSKQDDSCLVVVPHSAVERCELLIWLRPVSRRVALKPDQTLLSRQDNSRCTCNIGYIFFRIRWHSLFCSRCNEGIVIEALEAYIFRPGSWIVTQNCYVCIAQVDGSSSRFGEREN